MSIEVTKYKYHAVDCLIYIEDEMFDQWSDVLDYIDLNREFVYEFRMVKRE